MKGTLKKEKVKAFFIKKLTNGQKNLHSYGSSFLSKGGRTMATIHKTKNDLKKKIQQNTLISVGAWLFFIIYMILSTVNQWFQILFTLPLFFAMGTSYYFGHKNKILQIGLDGEEKALSVVSHLDSSYHVFSSGKVYYEGQESELDLIVVGKKGVFVIEVKNYRGSIEGKEEDRFWKQHKVGRKGTHYSQEFYSPVKQVGTHVYRLSKVLKQEQIFSWVQGVVYFVNEDVNIDRVETKQTPVLSVNNRFVDYVLSLEDKPEMTKEKIEEIAFILKSRLQ